MAVRTMNGVNKEGKKVRMQSKTFKQWLRSQKNRNDPIGDFARDAMVDPDFPKYVCKSPDKIADYLESHNACAGAIAAFNAGWQEFIQGNA